MGTVVTPTLVMRTPWYCAVGAALCLVTPATSRSVGSIQVKDYGEVWIATPSWTSDSTIEMLDNGFTLHGDSRLYFVNDSDSNFRPDGFWQVALLGKHFSFTVDLSNVGCHCNAAAYFINMPANADTEDFYCDASYVGGSGCPEYDVMEANKHNLASTIHTCKKMVVQDKWYDCDMWGCMMHAYNMDMEMMCPDEKCTINTNKPFRISSFQNSTVAFNQLEQEGRTTGFDLCHQPVLSTIAASSFNGMVFSAALWGSPGMGWLDGMTGCQGECDIDGSSVTFTNFALSDN